MDTLVPTEAIKGNEPAQLLPIQEALLPYVDPIATGWWIVWSVALVVFSVRALIVPQLQRRWVRG